jgi:hypothetical protein
MELTTVERQMLEVLRSSSSEMTDREIRTAYRERYRCWFFFPQQRDILAGMDTLQRFGLATGYVDYDGTRPVFHYSACASPQPRRMPE